MDKKQQQHRGHALGRLVEYCFVISKKKLPVEHGVQKADEVAWKERIDCKASVSRGLAKRSLQTVEPFHLSFAETLPLSVDPPEHRRRRVCTLQPSYGKMLHENQ